MSKTTRKPPSEFEDFSPVDYVVYVAAKSSYTCVFLTIVGLLPFAPVKAMLRVFYNCMGVDSIMPTGDLLLIALGLFLSAVSIVIFKEGVRR